MSPATSLLSIVYRARSGAAAAGHAFATGPSRGNAGCGTVQVMTRTYRFSSDPSEIDVPRVVSWLSQESYWAQGRTDETHRAAMAGSRNYGAYDPESGAQVGYARVITDGVTFGWLCDVFVDPDLRGAGVGSALMSGIIDDLAPLSLKRTALFTDDAHGLYERFGFEPLADAGSWMLRWGHGFGPQPPE
jgi:GNAT superfamily N-acetyltransferase